MGDFFQRHVNTADGIAVLRPLVCAWIGDYRQQVLGGGTTVVFGDDVLHALLPFDGQLLPRLSSAVYDDAVLQV